MYIYPERDDDTMVEVRSWTRVDRADLDKPLYEAVSTWLSADCPSPECGMHPDRRTARIIGYHQGTLLGKPRGVRERAFGSLSTSTST